MDRRVRWVFELLWNEAIFDFLCNSSAFLMEPGIFSAAGVKTTCAPYAFNMEILSCVILSGITKIDLYPLAAALIANPMPVFHL